MRPTRPSITYQEIFQLFVVVFGLFLVGVALMIAGCGPITPGEKVVQPVDCGDPIYVQIRPVDLTSCPFPGDPCRVIQSPVTVYADCIDCDSASNAAIRGFNDEYVAIETDIGVWTLRQEGTGAPNVGRCQTYRAAVVIAGYETVETEIHNPNPDNAQSNVLTIDMGTVPTQ